MTDKVQKILEDVERLCNAGLHNSTISKKNVLNTILAVVNDFKEEPVSEELEDAAITAADEDMQGRQIMEESNENRQLYSRIFRRGFKAGAKWQQQRDNIPQELVEDHAMLASMEKMKEEMMANGVDGDFARKR